MKKTITITLLLFLTFELTQAEPRQRHERKRHDSHNWIIERQQIGAVSGVPTTRRIRGSREIDVYRDGSMFEKNNFVGYDKR
jgi:hypothetical protein